MIRIIVDFLKKFFSVEDSLELEKDWMSAGEPLMVFYGSNYVLNPFMDSISLERDKKEQEKFKEALIGSVDAYVALTDGLYEMMGNSKLSFYRFFTDFIILELKETFLVDNPPKVIYELFPVDSIKIYNLSKMLLEIAGRQGKSCVNNKRFNRLFQDFFLSSLAYYDFIISTDNIGMFSKFRFNSTLFKKLKKSVEKLENFKITDFYPLVIRETIKYFGYNIKSENIFNKYIEIQTSQIENNEDIIEFEIFSYALAKKVEMFQKVCQCDNKRMKKYIFDTLFVIDSFYTNKINYREFINGFSIIDKELFHYCC